MPIRKFRTLEEMEDALWRSPDDPFLPRAIAEIWNFADLTCPQRFPAGVYKHRSVDEAQQLREVWDEANFQKFWQRAARAWKAKAGTNFPKSF